MLNLTIFVDFHYNFDASCINALSKMRTSHRKSKKNSFLFVSLTQIGDKLIASQMSYRREESGDTINDGTTPGNAVLIKMVCQISVAKHQHYNKVKRLSSMFQF